MWSLQFTCIKLVQDQVDALNTVFIPILIATIFLSPFVLKAKKNNRRRKLGDLKIFVLLALVGQIPAQVLMTIGTQQSTASNAAIINLTLPVVSALLAVVLLKEKMSKLRWVSFIVAIVGVALCSIKDILGVSFSVQYLTGNLLIFFGILGSGFYNTVCKRIANDYSEIEMIFYTYIFILLLLFPFVWYYEGNIWSDIPTFTTNTWIGLSLLTVFHSFLSMLLFFTALKKVEAIQVAISNFLITFFGLPIAILFLGEKLSSWSILGALLVLISTIPITAWEYKQKSFEKTITPPINRDRFD